jgi:hypothetical protein
MKPPDVRPAALIAGKTVCEQDVSATRLAIVHLEVAQIDVSISLALIGRLVEDLGPPLRLSVQASVLAEALVFALAINAAIGVRQRVQASFRDLATAKLASTVNPGGDTLQGVLDLPEFATLDLNQLRTDLVIRGVNRRIDVVSHATDGRELAKTVKVSVDRFAKSITSGDQSRG